MRRVLLGPKRSEPPSPTGRNLPEAQRECSVLCAGVIWCTHQPATSLYSLRGLWKVGMFPCGTDTPGTHLPKESPTAAWLAGQSTAGGGPRRSQLDCMAYLTQNGAQTTDGYVVAGCLAAGSEGRA